MGLFESQILFYHWEQKLLASMLSLKRQKGVACCLSSHFEKNRKNLFSLHASVQWKLQDNSVKKSIVCILPQLWSLCLTLIDIIISFSKTQLACWHRQPLSGRQITWLTRLACLLNRQENTFQVSREEFWLFLSRCLKDIIIILAWCDSIVSFSHWHDCYLKILEKTCKINNCGSSQHIFVQ